MTSASILRGAARAPSFALLFLIIPTLLTFLALLTAACGPATPDREVPADAAIAAEVAGAPISAAELDEWIKADLFRRAAETPSELYDMRRRALDVLIEERALEAEAARRGVEPGAVIEAMIAELEPVTDEEARAFFDEHSAEMPDIEFALIADQVRGFLEARRLAEARSRLQESVDVVVHLAPPRMEIPPDGAARGPAGARVTIVEFSDFQCPYCQQAVPALERIAEAYPDDVRLVYRHLPLDHIHPHARPAAEAAECARDQERFWDYHDLLFANPRALGRDELVGYATDLGLDADAFATCLDERKFAEKVSHDEKTALESGITGTPAFVVNGRLMRGALSFEEFAEVIDEELARPAGS